MNHTATIRETIEQLERESLHPLAAKSSQSKGRAVDEPHCPLRTDFQRDRDRILHSKAFRRLKHKTQVFISPIDDHYRTRLTHSLEVAQVSRTIARALRLNEDLTECIALGHDLGHPPFGHTGETMLNEVASNGFHHTQQTMRTVTVLGNLNLTHEVLDGIQADGQFETLEAHVVDLADRMAYLHHDVEDACRAGLMTDADLPTEIRQVLGNTRSERLDRMVIDVVTQSQIAMNSETPQLAMSAEVAETMMALRQWMFDHVYLQKEHIAQTEKVRRLIHGLFEFYLTHPEKISDNIPDNGDLEQRVVDYIAGMTDRYALERFQTYLLPTPYQPEGM